jgi:hypothetical protein
MYGEVPGSNPGCVPDCSEWMLVVFHSLLLNEGIVLGHGCLFTCVYLLSTEDHLSIQFDDVQHLHLKQSDYPGLNNVMRNNPSSFLRDEE